VGFRIFRVLERRFADEHEPASRRDHEQQSEQDDRDRPHPIPSDIRRRPIADEEEQAEGRERETPRLAGFVLDAFAGQTAPPIDPELDQLTPREKEVLRYIARGYAYKEIARELHISVKTVETHVSAVLRKLQLSSRYELSQWAAIRRIS
jgi:DNA-binding CsgD family transcriptional regulator